MTAVFGRDYADVYDAIYHAKDYAGEVELTGRLLARHGVTGPCRLLDIGCGTGRHAFAFTRRGYDVTGIDRSPFMLAHAKAAAERELLAGNRGPRFLEGDAKRLELGERFAAVTMMFTVLGYQHEDGDVAAVLAAVRAHLEPGGLFIFDVWNGLAVLTRGPEQRTATATEGGTHVVRTSSTRVEVEKQLCHVHFEVSRTGADGDARTWSEDHTLRYFLPSEIATVLRNVGLELLDLRRFPDGEAPPDEQAWNVIGVARAIDTRARK
jgi:SAM-dependent methyltransferase